MAYAGRNNIYEAAIKRMVTQALEAQEQEFLLTHGSDTDEQLLAYLQDCACRLGHTPWPREIAGGSLIEKRFGTWKNAIGKAGLSAPRAPDLHTSFVRVQEETQRQKVIYRQKKAEKKLRAQKRQALQEAKKKQTV